MDSIDFTDAPLSENTGRNYGLSQTIAFRALAGLLSDERIRALTITELNPDHGAADGSTLAAFVDGLMEALRGAFAMPKPDFKAHLRGHASDG